VPLYLLFQNAVQSSGAESLSSSEGLAQPRNGYFGAATPIYTSGGDICVAVEFLGFDPSTSDATFATVVSAASVGAEQYIQNTIIAGDSYQTGLLVIRSNFGLSTIVVPFPLSDLTTGTPSDACATGNSAPYNRGVGFREQESAYLLGQPRAFPNDWYELDDSVGVYLCPPPPKQAQNQCAGQVNLQSTASAAEIKPGTPSASTPSVIAQLGTPSVIATTRDQDLAMTVATGSGTLLGENAVAVRFVLQRPAGFALYTYWIAAMPFLLILGLFVMYACRKGRKGGGAVEYTPERTVPALHEIAFGVAATLVAILPLRAVLVPSALPNLTRLDIVFGIGITFLVASSIAWVWVWSQWKPVESPKTKVTVKVTRRLPGDSAQGDGQRPETQHGDLIA
jgi:hypothetical protein